MLGSACEANVNDQNEIVAVTILVEGRFQMFEEIQVNTGSQPIIVEGNGVEAMLKPDVTPEKL